MQQYPGASCCSVAGHQQLQWGRPASPTRRDRCPTRDLGPCSARVPATRVRPQDRQLQPTPSDCNRFGLPRDGKVKRRRHGAAGTAGDRCLVTPTGSRNPQSQPCPKYATPGSLCGECLGADEGHAVMPNGIVASRLRGSLDDPRLMGWPKLVSHQAVGRGRASRHERKMTPRAVATRHGIKLVRLVHCTEVCTKRKLQVAGVQGSLWRACTPATPMQSLLVGSPPRRAA